MELDSFPFTMKLKSLDCKLDMPVYVTDALYNN